MSYLALARKWRPQIFSEVIGQEHVVSALTNALDSQRVHHAFLFTGTRGVGKTTLARIFAKALNCEQGVSAEPCGECNACQGVMAGNFVDLIEVDAASRTKVDDTRELLDNVQYTPTLGRFKIYLIDEVHMLSTHSFNALLKTLEEPPEHVKFLFATTNPQKLPTTILSRCIQFNLKSVDIQRLVGQLSKILSAESIEHESAALNMLARSASGSVRDALSLLDQAIAYTNGQINAEQVRLMLGMVNEQYLVLLLKQLHSADGNALLETVSQMVEQASDFRSALDGLMDLIHNIALYQVSPQSIQWKNVDEEQLVELATLYDAEYLQLLFQFAVAGKRDFDYAPDPRSAFEAVLLRMLAFQPEGAGGSKISPKAQPIKAKPSTEKKQSVSNDNREIVRPSENSKIVADLDDLLNSSFWREFVTSSNLTGIYKEILMNMVPIERSGRELIVNLDSSSQAMFNNQRKKKIEEYFKDELNLDVVLNVQITEMEEQDDESSTPSRQLDKQKNDLQMNATQNFLHDSNVQALVDMFDAEVVTDSIQPATK